MVRRAAKTDTNQTPMVAQLRGAGLHVVDTHALGDGFPDLVVVAYNLRTGRIDALLVEVKTDKGKLTPDERVFHDAFPQGGPLLVARDAADVLAWFGRL